MSRPRAGLCALILVAVAADANRVVSNEPEAADSGWIDLFNGRNLSGWETSLGPPFGESQPIGRNRDPGGVFRVVEVDGEPAIRISGENLGGLATVEGYGNYILEFEFKWGEGRFAPRAALPRDSGLLYHGQDSYNAGSGWLESLEFGILEGGETGDFWSVPGADGIRVLVDVEGVDIPPEERRYPEESIQHRPGGKAYIGTVAGILNSDDNEKPRGAWNKLELICVGQTSLHVVNGTVNLVLTNARRRIGDREEPLSSGRLQLQSEGAEVFYRRLRLRPIDEIPEAYREAMTRPPHNELTAEEQSEGWQLLFDGRSTEGWRGYRLDAAPEGWQVKGGALVRVEHAGELITTETFGDFELALEWKISHGGNSGIFYRATEEGDAIYETGPEYEIRDNAFWVDNPYSTAANYGLHPYDGGAARPVGYWNKARIVVDDNKVEHWLNGVRTAEYELNSPEWLALVQEKAYTRWPGYGKAEKGHIGLQDHEALVWYRNIKLRPLD